ncbi:SGNH/GDSL hydrolase family protein [Bradyrhizobium sp. sBnM-33]|uniref:SGNH/GDSL hydrolase family protein n=1 Tax=Bradyrhizobium sp. sBnM-33 TaxID=2831780 RepID=UPI001BCAAD25|nr:SGNH/GDSL hydrolase family protein [Bradyrhizobium sp. sBnM-33]
MAFAGFLAAGGTDRQANGALSIVSILLCLFAANVYLEFFRPRGWERPPEGIKIAREQGVPFDERSKYQVVADLRAEGRRAYPTVHVGDLLNDPPSMSALRGVVPLGGVTRVLSVLCNETGTYTLFNSDRYGFKNDDAAYDRPVDTLVVGDSYAQGFCVPPEDDVAAQLRAHGQSAVSVGSGGNGALLALASLMEYGSLLRPKTVLWLYFNGNDLSDLAFERDNPVLRGYLEGRTQNLAARTAELDALLTSFIDAKEVEWQQRLKEPVPIADRIRGFLTASRLRRFLRLDRDSWNPNKKPEAQLALFEQVLREARSVASGWNGRIVFVYLPEWEHYAKAPSPNRQPVLEIARRLGFPTVDFARVLDESDDPLSYFPFRIKNHYTPEGYRRLAGEIAKQYETLGR